MSHADTSSIEHAIIRATHDILTKPDWSANIGICDWLKRRPMHIPQAIRIIRIRLKHKSLAVQNTALELVATLMKNCSEVRPAVADPEFIKFLLNKVPKKLKEPNARFFLITSWSRAEGQHFERILALLKSWAREYGNSSRGRTFRQFYDLLKSTGCKFPSLSGGDNIPVSKHRDKKSSSSNRRQERKATVAPPKSDPKAFTDRECRTAMETYILLEQMLTASDPKKRLDRDDLIQSLLTQVVAAQKSIAKRVTTTSSPSVLDELLRANDKLLWVMNYYKGLLSGTMKRIVKQEKKQPKMEDKKAKKTKSEKKKKVPTLKEVERLKKIWQAKRKEWRAVKPDKKARSIMRAAKKEYEAAKEAYEDADEDEDEDEEEEKIEKKPKKVEKKKADKAKPYKAPPAALFNLAPPPDEPEAPTFPEPSPAPTQPKKPVAILNAPAQVVSNNLEITENGDDDDPFAELEDRHENPTNGTTQTAAPSNAIGIDLFGSFEDQGSTQTNLTPAPAPAVENQNPQATDTKNAQPSLDIMADLFG